MTDLKMAMDKGDTKAIEKVYKKRNDKRLEEKKKALFEKHNGLTLGEYAMGKINNLEDEVANELFDEDDCDMVFGDDYIFLLYEYNGKFEFGDIICFHANESVILYNKLTKEFKEEYTR